MAPKKILVIDVGGSHVKLLATGHRTPRKIPSGPDLTPSAMVEGVKAAAADWDHDVISIGFPGPVSRGEIAAEPRNLGTGWMGFDFAAELGRPVRVINDAAMQALGSYDGGRMLFLGLGTGLGTTLVREGTVIPLEAAHLPYRRGRSFEEYVGAAGLERLGRKKWRRHVAEVVSLLSAALLAEYVVLGGGNVRLLKELPENARRGSNLNAFRGGYRLWTSGVTVS
jgi:polyphosphate glucokinase